MNVTNFLMNICVVLIFSSLQTILNEYFCSYIFIYIII